MEAHYHWRPDYIPAAQEALAEERERTQTEQDAFTAFHEQVAALEPQPSTLTGGEKLQCSIRSLLDQSQSDALGEVHEAYQKTVMQTPHYAAEYGDTLEESLKAEFGPELAQVLTDTERLTPTVQQTLLSAIQKAQNRRDAFLSLLDEEATALDEAVTTLEEIGDTVTTLNTHTLAEWPSTELADMQNQTETLEHRCDKLAHDRQLTLQTPQHNLASRRFEGREFRKYLYASVAVTYPILADIALLGGSVQTTRQRLERALSLR